VDERRERPLIERHGHTQAWFIKGKEHNRGSTSLSSFLSVLDVCNSTAPASEG